MELTKDIETYAWKKKKKKKKLKLKNFSTIKKKNIYINYYNNKL